MLVTDAIEPAGASFVAARDAFFKLGPAAEVEYSRACNEDRLLERAPQLTNLFRNMARQALPAIIDAVHQPRLGVLLMPWPGQLAGLQRADLLDALEDLVLDGVSQLRKARSNPLLADLPPDIGRAALAAYALGEWAASHPADRRRVCECLQSARASLPTPSVLQWIRTADEQLPFAAMAGLYRAGETDPLDRAWQSIKVRMESLAANEKRDDVPRPWFMMRLHHALLTWWRGDLAEAARLQADALDNLQLTAGSGVAREVIAEACVHFARMQARLPIPPADPDRIEDNSATNDPRPARVAQALEQALGYGFDDVGWLRAIDEFQPLRGDAAFRKVLARIGAAPADQSETPEQPGDRR